MRFLVLVFALTCFSYANINTKIKDTTSLIDSVSKTQKELNSKMSKNAEDILSQKQNISNQEKLIKELEYELEERESHYEISKVQLSELQGLQENLQKNIDQTESELREAISQSVAISIILEQKYSATEESLVNSEVFALMLKQVKQKIEDLQASYKDSSNNIKNLNKEISNLSLKIKTIEAKKQEVLKLNEKNKKMLASLESAKESYKKELRDILNKQNELKTTLNQLNIIKIDELRKAEEKKAQEEALKAKDVAVATHDLPDVKQKGSSYQDVKTILYNGKKTIPPFKPYTITKKYGNYTDPLYGIKVFNESINMKSSQKDQKVQVVFNGKVIYADRTAVLNNIVIVEHDNGLHTIYANLSQIAPSIKKGTKIKQGTIIGRIDDELIFEATQKSFHLNPQTLFE